MAREAVVGQDRPDVAVELNDWWQRLCGLWGHVGGARHRRRRDRRYRGAQQRQFACPYPSPQQGSHDVNLLSAFSRQLSAGWVVKKGEFGTSFFLSAQIS